MDEFDWGDIDYGAEFGGNFDLGGSDLGGIDLGEYFGGNFDLGDLGLSDIDFGEYFGGNFDLGGLGLGGAGGDYVSGTTGFADAADEVGQGTAGITGLEGFGAAADEVGGAGGYSEEDLKDKFWKELIGTGTAVPGGGVITTDSKGRTIITYDDGTTKVLNEGTGGGAGGKGGGSGGGGKGGGGGLFGMGKDNTALLAALLGGLMGLLGRSSAPKLPVGYQGSIPKYTAKRVPGRGVEYTKAAQGGLMGLKQGRYLDGATDGMADKIQTDIDGKQPARLSHGEFVVPADVVSHLGNGNSDAGADVLYDMMAKVRKARTGTPKQGKQINPRKMIPA